MAKRPTNEDLAVQELTATRGVALARATLSPDRELSVFHAYMGGELLAEFAVSRLGHGDTSRVLDALVTCMHEAGRVKGD